MMAVNLMQVILLCSMYQWLYIYSISTVGIGTYYWYVQSNTGLLCALCRTWTMLQKCLHTCTVHTYKWSVAEYKVYYTVVSLLKQTYWHRSYPHSALGMEQTVEGQDMSLSEQYWWWTECRLHPHPDLGWMTHQKSVKSSNPPTRHSACETLNKGDYIHFKWPWNKALEMSGDLWDTRPHESRPQWNPNP